MKYIRYEFEDEIYAGIVEDNKIYRLDYSNIIDVAHNEDEIKASYHDSVCDDIDSVKILPPTDVTKVVCVGLNYYDHAKELDMQLPSEPLLFIKPSTAVIANGEEIIYPGGVGQLDYEGELAIVILDKITRDNNKDEYLLGFSVFNDVTARDLQNKDGQWTRAKSFDSFAPYGPVVSTDVDAENLDIKLEVNGEIRQNSNTKNMIFTPSHLVEYISNIMTLNPGDVIATGTPPGVGQLECGDVVKVTIEDIGTLENIVKK